MENKKDYQQMMEELFVVYYEQCPNEKIKYSIFDFEKNQGHIVLLDEWMEIIHFSNHQYGYSIKFVIVSNEIEMFFDTYNEAIKFFYQ